MGPFLWKCIELQIQMDRKVLANQLDIVVVEKKQMETVMTDITVPSDSNNKKDGYEKLERYQGLKEELLDAVVVGARRTVTPKLKEWLRRSQKLSLFFLKSLMREITELGSRRLLLRMN